MRPPWRTPPLPDEDLLVVAFTSALALTVRAAVGLHPHSGEGQPPMFGDYEAHRHWMEVATGLPPGQWYVQGPDNDLQYWGIDYPPLSAYWAWVLGVAAKRREPAMVALHLSRGYESPTSRAFMRSTVLVADALIFLPAARAVARATSGGATRRRLAFAALALQPALLIVDHGHFQYNGVSLGLSLAAVAYTLGRRLGAAAVLFCLALNFKQMSLYYAPAFFAHMFGICLQRDSWPQRVKGVAFLGAMVIATFSACWAPILCHGGWRAALPVLRRLFPVSRHIYEDKVANAWCVLSVVPALKLRANASPEQALRVSLALVVASLALPCAAMMRRPSARGFQLGLVTCGLGFFLFSFQVHEKHILLPLVPATAFFSEDPLLVGWMSTVSCFSMFPLLSREGLRTAYAGVLLIFATLAAVARGVDPPLANDGGTRGAKWRHSHTLRAVSVSALGMGALHTLEALVPAPSRYPDLHALLFCAFAFAHFAGAWLVLQAWHLKHLLHDVHVGKQQVPLLRKRM